MARDFIFWDVDTQVDFMLPRGKLYVPGAEQIIPNLEKLTLWAEEQRILVVASADAHLEGDPEFQQYPPHCLAGTPGQEKIPQTRIAGAVVIPNRPVELPELRNVAQVVIEKQQFDVFTNPNTSALLDVLAPRQVVLYGVVTEICVARAAAGLLDRDLKITLVTDAIRHLDEQKARQTIEEVERRGGTLVTTSEFLRQAA